MIQREGLGSSDRISSVIFQSRNQGIIGDTLPEAACLVNIFLCHSVHWLFVVDPEGSVPGLPVGPAVECGVGHVVCLFVALSITRGQRSPTEHFISDRRVLTRQVLQCQFCFGNPPNTSSNLGGVMLFPCWWRVGGWWTVAGSASAIQISCWVHARWVRRLAILSVSCLAVAVMGFVSLRSVWHKKTAQWAVGGHLPNWHKGY